ncbi:MAG: hypothetical protein [Bacteriophage sp.]|nr:MAG: hypothetical protein [Bacteriophage sp.]
MKELEQFTIERLAKWISAGKEAKEKHDGIRMAGEHVEALARIALAVKNQSEPHKRMEVWDGGNTWIQCSKQAYDRAETSGQRVRVLYERPALNSPEIPDGWQLVPIEPTRQMMAQGHFAMGGTDRGKFRRIYQAMVAAAPRLEG